jgi:U3 small nucleolar RNA-associated protein 6
MAAASDKARFYLEQSVPELKEFERKKIFSAEEISKIARQRSDFEHKINARGSTSADYVRYAEFEMNVDALRKKRVKRLGIKSTTYNGQRRIFFVLDRGTRRHPADISLWLQSLEYARKQQAHKKVTQVLTNVLRLHPTRPELWIYAAQFAMEENGDMTEARGYIQRGLRFNKNRKALWLQYIRLEMSHIAKLQARRDILGISQPTVAEEATEQESDAAALTADDVIPDEEEIDPASDCEALAKMNSVLPASGAIVNAIYDAAELQFDNDPDFSVDTLAVLEDYSQLAATSHVLRHIRDHLQQTQNDHWVLRAANIWFPVVGLDPSSAEFPGALRTSLKYLRSDPNIMAKNGPVSVWAKSWLQRILQVDDLDPALEQVVRSIVASL